MATVCRGSHGHSQAIQQKLEPRITALLCHSPSISSDTNPQLLSNQPCTSAQRDARMRSATTGQCQTAAQHPGLSIHQVDVHHATCTPSSAQSKPKGALLQAGTSAAHTTNAATVATAIASCGIDQRPHVSMPQSRCGATVDHCSTMTGAQQPCHDSRQQVMRSPELSTMTHSARLVAAATSRSPGPMSTLVHRDMTAAAQHSICSSSTAANSFLCACATPGAVAALGVLAHHNMLPVRLQHDVGPNVDSSLPKTGELLCPSHPMSNIIMIGKVCCHSIVARCHPPSRRCTCQDGD